jgi:N5-(carboxyethyl)ornithine synthase
MNSVAFPIPAKENERRRALLPEDVRRTRSPESLYFEEGYGATLGLSDDAYVGAGANTCERMSLFDHPIVCCMKAPPTEEFARFSPGQCLFGWMHAVQSRTMADFLVGKELTAIAWEDMHAGGRHVFWENNEIAGYAAILHALPFLGRDPRGLKVALIGRGNVARGVSRALAQLGSTVVVFDRNSVSELHLAIGSFDLVVNAVLWDVFRKDHLVTINDLGRMRPGSMIVDISCDEGMGIQSSRPTTITSPTYVVQGIIHYAVDHTPTLLHRWSSESISRALIPYVDALVAGEENQVLSRATAVLRGTILDERVARFQSRDKR